MTMHGIRSFLFRLRLADRNRRCRFRPTPRLAASIRGLQDLKADPQAAVLLKT
jgi:hypothetical protein